MKNRIYLIQVLWFLLLPGILHADKIFTIQGKLIEGKILRLEGENIEYKTQSIPFLIIVKKNVEKIIYNDGTVVRLNDSLSSSEKKPILLAYKEVVEETRENESDTHDHTGFYFTYLSGANLGANPNLDFSAGKVDFVGTSFAGYFGFGGALYQNLNFFVPIAVSGMYTIDSIKINGVNYTSNISSIKSYGIGGGINYYFEIYNVYLSAAFTSTVTAIEYRNLEGSFGSKSGNGIYLLIGKEWWLSRNWGLGFAVYYHSVDTKFGNDTGILELNNASYKNTMYGIAISTTYN